MTLTKRTYIDRMEIVTDFRHLQLREATVIEEDGKEISRSFHRRVLTPDMDVSKEDSEIQELANVLWKEPVKKAWAEFKDKSRANL